MPKPSGARKGDAADVEMETVGECPGWNLCSVGGKVGVVLKYGECILFQESLLINWFRPDGLGLGPHGLNWKWRDEPKVEWPAHRRVAAGIAHIA